MMGYTRIQQWQGCPLCLHQSSQHVRTRRSFLTAAPRTLIHHWRGQLPLRVNLLQKKLVANYSQTSEPHVGFTESKESSVELHPESLNVGLMFGNPTVREENEVHKVCLSTSELQRDDSVDSSSLLSSLESDVSSNGARAQHTGSDISRVHIEHGREKSECGGGGNFQVDEATLPSRVVHEIAVVPMEAEERTASLTSQEVQVRESVSGLQDVSASSSVYAENTKRERESDIISSPSIEFLEDRTTIRDEVDLVITSSSTDLLQIVHQEGEDFKAGGNVQEVPFDGNRNLDLGEPSYSPLCSNVTKGEHDSAEHITELKSPPIVNGHPVEFDRPSEGDKDEVDDFDYYIPESGHRVVGVVVSGNHFKLDINIGAAKLGHLHIKELLPIDKVDVKESNWEIPFEGSPERDEDKFVPPAFNQAQVVYDQEVFEYEDPAPLPVEVGTVLNLEVLGESLGGNPLLSARRAARRIAWERVRQIKQQKEPIEIEITEWSDAGVITRIEGLRAFLPAVEFVKHPEGELSETFKDYVGRKVSVLISIAEETRGNLVISERQAWVRKNLLPGTVLDGTVVQFFSFGARVQIDGTDISGLIHISNIAHARIYKISDIFEVGEKIKVMAVDSPVPNRVAFSTADLESEPGLMLRDKQRVFREAEETARAFREAHKDHEPCFEGQEQLDRVKPQKPISNFGWLDFGENIGTLL